jgi:hypothetical protein
VAQRANATGGGDRAVRRACVPARAPRQVAADLAAELQPTADSLVLAFVSSELPAGEVAPALADAMAPATVVGCTSIGEIAGPVTTGTAVALRLDRDRIGWGVGLAAGLSRGPLQAARAAVTDAAAGLGLTPDELDPARHVAITLVDGRSSMVEGFCLGSSAAAPRVGFVGGAASDACDAPRASDHHAEPRPDFAAIFHGGAAHRDAGLVVMLAPSGSFEVITSEHMIPTPLRVVVTGADPVRRVVTELDGMPAARRYGEVIREAGANGPLDSALAARFPFAIYINGRPYVRSVSVVAGDELRLAAAVDEGAVLRIMRPGDLVAQTRAALAGTHTRVGALDAVITFSCLGRHIEAMTRGATGALDDVYAMLPVCGFHSFGEQAGPLLVNHTLAALALGGRDGGT